MKRIQIIALLGVLALSAPAATYAQSVSAADEATVSLDFHDVDIQDVVKAIAEITGKNFVLDDRVRGRISIISPTPVSVTEAYQAFLSALEVKNLTTVEEGKITEIVPIREGKSSSIPFDDKGRIVGAQVVTRIIPLEHIDANQISQALKSLVSRTGTIVAYGPTNSLIITDTASNINRLVKLIRRLDQPGFEVGVEVIPLRHAQAEDVAQKLNNIFEQERSQQRRSRFSRRSRDVEAGEMVSKIMPDTRTNALIVQATRKGLERILDLVAELDRPVALAKGQSKIHVKFLKYANAEDLAGLLSGLVSGQSKNIKGKSKTGIDEGKKNRGFSSAPPLPWQNQSDQNGNDSSADQDSAPVPGSGPLIVGKGGMFEGEVRIAADGSRNALIITANPNDYQMILPVIEQLDVRRPQVLVETLIMEVSISKLTDVGISGHGAGGANGIGGLGLLNFGTVNALGVANADSANALVSDATKGLVVGGLTEKTFTIPGTGLSIPVGGAVFQALQTSKVFNVLSAPNILATDNEKAEIDIVKNISFATSQYTADEKPVTSFSREKVGLRLAVTPQINEGDSVTLEVEQKVEEVPDTASTGAGSNPTTSERTAKTTVVAENGQTVVLGGLIQDKQRRSVHKVPLLGDIPLIGYLFRKTSVDNEKINLMLFLTPNVVRDPKDITRVSVKKNEERVKFLKKHDIGENPALYDYGLNEGSNFAPPPEKSSKKEEQPQKRFNYEDVELDDESTPVIDGGTTSPAPVAGKRLPRRRSTNPTAIGYRAPEANTNATEEPALNGNPFADVRPPSSTN